MKKSLIALAIASAVSAPAFAATSNVDIYGVLNLAVSGYDNEGSKDDPADVQFSSIESRVGIKGVEDLGGGMAAIWQVESGIDADEGNGSWASRNTFVGLKTGLGTVLLGNHDTPTKLVGRAVDLFGGTVADARNVTGNNATKTVILPVVGSTTVTAFANAHEVRAKNVLAYISPTFSGITVVGAWVNDLGAPVGVSSKTPDTANQSVYDVSATGTWGPVFLGASYGDGELHDALGLGASYRAVGGLTLGMFKLVGQYDLQEADGAVQGDYESWMVGGSIALGAFAIKADYLSGEYDNYLNDREQWAVGADYNMSKRTKLYALYAYGENVTFGSTSSDPVVAAKSGLNDDTDTSVISAGIVHNF
jgi:predicted porin